MKDHLQGHPHEPSIVQQPGDGAALNTPGPHVLIIGGGASGVLMAVHLLSQPGSACQVSIIEQRDTMGSGLAYGTDDPDHLLNTRVLNMSAFPDRPDHFRDWLAVRRDHGAVDGHSFVSRATYGAYLADLLSEWTMGSSTRRLHCLRQSCLRLEDTGEGVVAHLSDGQAVSGGLAVLATGHVVPEPDAAGLICDPWQPLGAINPAGRVVIVGSGLTMVDQVLSLLNAGHRGEILSISRRGQLPRAHAGGRPMPLSPEQVPLRFGLSDVMRWARGLAAEAERAGGTWRDAVDGIRPHVHRIWRGLSVADRARFLRHAATWWDVHRHRMPPGSAERLQTAIASGQVQMRRGAFLGVTSAGQGGLAVKVRLHGTGSTSLVPAVRVIDCRGIRRDPAEHASPLTADLLTWGRARVDPLRLGLDVDTQCRVIDAQGVPNPRILAIGPASRAAFWEITAIPDIREQVARLAAVVTAA